MRPLHSLFASPCSVPVSLSLSLSLSLSHSPKPPQTEQREKGDERHESPPRRPRIPSHEDLFRGGLFSLKPPPWHEIYMNECAYVCMYEGDIHNCDYFLRFLVWVCRSTNYPYLTSRTARDHRWMDGLGGVSWASYELCLLAIFLNCEKISMILSGLRKNYNVNDSLIQMSKTNSLFELCHLRNNNYFLGRTFTCICKDQITLRIATYASHQIAEVLTNSIRFGQI